MNLLFKHIITAGFFTFQLACLTLQAEWTVPGAGTLISPQGQKAEDPQIGISANGEAVSVWRGTVDNQGVIQGARISVQGSSWVATSNVSIQFNAAAPHIAVSPTGYAVAVWNYRLQSNKSSISSAILQAGETTWSSPINISSIQQSTFRPRVGINASGLAIALWAAEVLQAGQRKGFVIDAARMPFNSSSWIQLGQISPSPADEEETFNRARLAVGPEGNAVAVWHFASSTKGEFGQSANYPVDAAHFNSFITLGNDVSEIDVAIGGNGDAIAVADSNNAIASRYLLFGTNEWSNPAVLATGTLLSSARVGADAQGNAVAIWSNLVNLQSSTFSNATKTWSSPITIPKDSATNTVGNPQIAVDPKGNAVAIWRGNVFGSQPQRHLIQVATLKAGTNEWTGLTVLSDINQDANHPHIAIDANSNAVAVWQQSNGTSTEIRTSIGTNLFP